MDILDTTTDTHYPDGKLNNLDIETAVEPSETSEETDTDDEDMYEGVGMRVVFQGIEYIVTNQANRKEKLSLLKGVSGVLYPGLMSALMGPSGSGKTTLLDVLAGRKTVGQITGTILFAGRRPSVPFLRRYTGYVEQHDTLLANLTVYEQLLYTSELKNSQKESLARKKERVDIVIDQLAMESCKGVRIGSALKRGISGGQAKRTNIGIALVTNPRVLFLDEPTSGLDSYTANEVMLVVKSLVKSGMTICATIHSPTPFCFNLFDRMMILLGGTVIYNGHNGLPAVHFFEETNPQLPRYGSFASEKDNPAEWIVDITTQADREGRRLEFAEQYKASDLCNANTLLVEAEVGNTEPPTEAMLKELNTKKATTTSFLFGLQTILKYRMSKDYLDPQFLGPRTMDKLAIAFIIFTLYWKSGKGLQVNPDPSDVAARELQFTDASNIGAMLFVWTILPAFAASTYIPSLVIERTIYYRERADGLFRPITYLVAKLVEELIIAFVVSAGFSAVVFYPVGLTGSYPLFFLIKFVTTAIGIVLGYLVAAVSPTMEVANAILPAYVVSLLFFVGLLIRFPDIPQYWRWFTYLNPLRYAWVAMMNNQFANSNLIIPYNGNIMDYYGIAGTKKWVQLGYESLFFAGFFTAAWLAFSFIKHQKR